MAANQPAVSNTTSTNDNTQNNGGAENPAPPAAQVENQARQPPQNTTTESNVILPDYDDNEELSTGIMSLERIREIYVRISQPDFESVCYRFMSGWPYEEEILNESPEILRRVIFSQKVPPNGSYHRTGK